MHYAQLSQVCVCSSAYAVTAMLTADDMMRGENMLLGKCPRRRTGPEPANGIKGERQDRLLLAARAGQVSCRTQFHHQIIAWTPAGASRWYPIVNCQAAWQGSAV